MLKGKIANHIIIIRSEWKCSSIHQEEGVVVVIRELGD